MQRYVLLHRTMAAPQYWHMIATVTMVRAARSRAAGGEHRGDMLAATYHLAYHLACGECCCKGPPSPPPSPGCQPLPAASPCWVACRCVGPPASAGTLSGSGHAGSHCMKQQQHTCQDDFGTAWTWPVATHSHGPSSESLHPCHQHIDRDPLPKPERCCQNWPKHLPQLHAVIGLHPPALDMPHDRLVHLC
jgi:hypothetical protein